MDHLLWRGLLPGEHSAGTTDTRPATVRPSGCVVQHLPVRRDSGASAMIAIDHLTIQAGAFTLEDISFEVAAGQYAVLMGPTGCGKTTLLEVICGLKPVRAGRVLLMGRD